MAGDPSRRALLTTLGTVGLAGCSGAGLDSETPTAAPDPGPPDEVDAEWSTPGYDHRRANFSPETAGPVEPVAELWSASTDAALSPPVVADAAVYVGGDDGVVRAFDARTGENRWRTSVGASAGTPRAVEGRLSVPATGRVVALDPGDGAELWRVETPDRQGFLAAPHGRYFLRVVDEDATLVSLDDEGSERWRTTLDGSFAPDLFASGDTVFVPIGGGKPWMLDAETGEPARKRRRVAAEDAADARCYRDGTVYSTEPFFGEVHALEPPPPYDYRWRARPDADAGFELAVGADRLYVHAEHGEEPGLYALSPSDGEAVWHDGSVPELVSRPVAAGETLLVHTADGLRCLDPADGTKRWQRSADGIGSQVVPVDDLLYTTRDGTVRAFRSP